MNEVTNWTFGETEVRTIELDGEPWWVLSDVCKVLELSNPTVVANRLEEDERSKFDLGRQGTATTSTKTQTYNGSDGNVHSKVHTYWTQKGRLFIYDLLKENGILPLIEQKAVRS